MSSTPGSTASAFHLDKITRIHWYQYRGSSFADTTVAHVASRLLGEGIACHWQFSTSGGPGSPVDVRQAASAGERELWVFHINLIRRSSALEGAERTLACRRGVANVGVAMGVVGRLRAAAAAVAAIATMAAAASRSVVGECVCMRGVARRLRLTPGSCSRGSIL